MNVDELKVEIFDLLSRADGTTIDKSYAIYSRIMKVESQDEQTDLFKYACEFFGTKKSTKELKIPNIITDEEKDELEKALGKYVNGILDHYLRRNLSEIDFYSGLWKSLIKSDEILEDEKDIAFAIYYILIDKRIPYFQLGTSVMMSNEKYREISERLTNKKHKIRFILSIPIDSKTERSGYLLELLDEYSEAPEERAVLMSYLIDSVKKQKSSTSSMISELDKLRELSELSDALDSLVGS